MPLKNYDSQRGNTCLKIVLALLYVSVSAFSEEELILEELNDAQIEEALPQSKTKPSAKKPSKTFQIESDEAKPAPLPTNTLSDNDFTIKANKLIAEKKYSQATAILWANIERLNQAELVLLSKAHYLNKDYFEAMKAANLVLAKNENSFEALTYLGLSQLRKKKDREAKEYFRRATEANPVYMPAINGLVEIYEKSANYYELRLIYQDLIKRVGEKSEYLTKLCDINTKDAITDDAQLYCRKAVQADPTVPENYSNLGIVYKNINEMSKAKQQLQVAADKFPKSDINQLNYAQFLEEQKNFIEAFKYYNRCVKINDFVEKCWVGYTSSSYQIQKFAETLTGLKKSCAFNKKHSFLGRKAASFARSVKQSEWARKLDSLSEICGN
jgi:tetratricopeptide (TPR) repeat protein